MKEVNLKDVLNIIDIGIESHTHMHYQYLESGALDFSSNSKIKYEALIELKSGIIDELLLEELEE